MEKNKKGDLTSTQLITIIILIISFSVLLIFYFSLNLKSNIDKDSCRNSVIMRGSLPTGKDAVQLKCKTVDTCLSMGDNCNVANKNIETIKVQNENELMKEMATLLSDCWWMMGEGKVDYMPSNIIQDSSYCTICNKIYFDKKIQDKYPDGIPYLSLFNYMKSNKAPGKDESYLFYIYNLNSLDSIRNNILESQKRDIYQYKIDTKKDYAVMTALTKQIGTGKVIAKFGSVIGGGVIGYFVGGGAKGAIQGLALGAAVASQINPNLFYMYPEFVEFNLENLENLIKCTEYVSEG